MAEKKGKKKDHRGNINSIEAGKHAGKRYIRKLPIMLFVWLEGNGYGILSYIDIGGRWTITYTHTQTFTH